MNSIAIPGQYLDSTSACQSGPGTHIHNARIYASILGPVVKSASPIPTGPAKRLTKITSAMPLALPTLSINRNISLIKGASNTNNMHGKLDSGVHHDHHGDIKKINEEVLPEVNSTVLCRVTRITPKQATVSILVAGETVLNGEWQGLIRVQDVRATEKEKVKIFESFRPGDIVRAAVISLGDQSNYYLSTASNNLGVIMAVSEAGNAMYPVSWKEYRDPETGASECRKVAKPF
ncbi:hypothetical protein Golomagni_04185 [Golovinomyces magnicellulatus]|nr:hypothetical protein Golomagni_04185 [Golovinomyces magnicellulatus]